MRANTGSSIYEGQANEDSAGFHIQNTQIRENNSNLVIRETEEPNLRQSEEEPQSSREQILTPWEEQIYRRLHVKKAEEQEEGYA